jgi:RsiW-degrading membrane proteinase PrsW (M82 family)
VIIAFCILVGRVKMSAKVEGSHFKWVDQRDGVLLVIIIIKELIFVIKNPKDYKACPNNSTIPPLAIKLHSVMVKLDMLDQKQHQSFFYVIFMCISYIFPFLFLFMNYFHFVFQRWISSLCVFRNWQLYQFVLMTANVNHTKRPHH